MSETPFCEKWGCWSDELKNMPPFTVMPTEKAQELERELTRALARLANEKARADGYREEVEQREGDLARVTAERDAAIAAQERMVHQSIETAMQMRENTDAELAALRRDRARLEFLFELFAKRGQIDGLDFMNLARAELDAAMAKKGGEM